MTDTKRDVNAEFGATKLAQMASAETRLATLRANVANGTMREIGEKNGIITFEVTEGWDRNEYVRFNTKNLELEMAHGLDVVNGKVSLYLNTDPAWHTLGNVIQGGLSEVGSVLSAGGIDFTVATKPLTHLNPVTMEMEVVDGKFINYREDTGKALGIVGSIYTALQNREAYLMLEDLIGYGMICESAGSMDNGAKVFVTAELPSGILIDPNGIGDHVRLFLAILNSHDGKSPLTAVLTPWRVACGNTHRFAVRDAVAKWTIRHTKNAKNKIDEARRALGLTVEYAEKFASETNELAVYAATNDDLDKLIDEIWEMKDDSSKRAVTLSTARREKIHEIFDYEGERIGRTAYAAENAITGYVDHFAELRPRGALKGNRLAALGTAIMNGTFDDVKSTAHTKLLQRVRGA